MSTPLALYDDEAHDYDALLVVSFGGPEGPEDVMPFLDNVLRGLPVKPETQQRIAQRYYDFGGISPINGQTRAFIDALRRELDAHGPALPVYWGNRNWHPMLADTLARMQQDGVRRALVFVTSLFSSYSGCRKYREDLHQAVEGLDSPPVLDKLRLGFNHPRFIEANASRCADALNTLPADRRNAVTILFSAHSLPDSMARHARYQSQLLETCQLIGDAIEHQRWQLVFQSNNASYGRESWLGPDVCDAIRALAESGAEDVIVAPVGFVCDHLEVVLDLDVDAATVARDAGIGFLRAETVGTHPAYIDMVRDLIVERMSPHPERAVLGTLGPSHDRCPPDCCLSGRPMPAKPSLCGADAAA